MTSLFGTSGMAPKKLSDSDKQEILDRYCHSDETTVTLAAQYGVSTSTISRILKQSLPEQEYEALVQQKRYGKGQSEQEMLPGIMSAETTEFADQRIDFESESDELPIAAPKRRQRKRSTAGLISVEQLAASAAHLSQLEPQLELTPPIKRLDALDSYPPLDIHQPALEALKPIEETVVPTEAFGLDDELEDDGIEDELDDELEDDELDELDDELEDDELDELDDGGLGDDLASLDSMQLTSASLLQILPLAEAPMPRTCYVVVDRSSELITRPLKDFAELGQISTQEIQERTLPIFDNHRVAKRFLRRMQRIVKVPDGRIFQKVKPYLQAKGITHLLIDGQVYSL